MKHHSHENMTGMDMNVDQVKAVLHANEGSRLRITFIDGLIQSVDVNWVDDEGFGHSGPEGAGQKHWWTRFEHVKSIDSINVD